MLSKISISNIVLIVAIFGLLGCNTQLRDIEKQVEQDPDNISIRYKLAANYHYYGKYEDELNQYKDIIEIDPNNAEAYLKTAQLYVFQDNLSLAMENYEKALSLNVKHDTIYSELHLVASQLSVNNPEYIDKATEYSLRALSENTNKDYCEKLIETLDTLSMGKRQLDKNSAIIIEFVSDELSNTNFEESPECYYRLLVFLAKAYSVSDSIDDKKRALKYYDEALIYYKNQEDSDQVWSIEIDIKVLENSIIQQSHLQ